MNIFMKVLIWCCALSLISRSVGEDVTVTVKGGIPIAETDNNFICVTVDWWPINKCDYGQCPWGLSSIINLDLRNEILFKAVKAFKTLRIRLGGSMQDQILYNKGDAITECPDIIKEEGGMFGFSKGCLHMHRWDAINRFFNDTGAVMTFGLNALFGRIKLKNDTQFVGDWNPENTRDFIKYTISKGYKIDSYELGNELCGTGVSGKVDAKQYAKDMKVLKQLVEQLYPDLKTRPKVLGPGGFFEKEWFKTFLLGSGPNVVEGLTHHIYNLGAGVDKDLINKVQDPFFLSQVAQTFRTMAAITNKFGPWAGAWVGESGGAYNSGGKDVSHTFANGFWYLDQLGMTAAYNHKVYCRQALIGGNYALLNTTTFIPNPDYYGALLWHRLMGPKVLATSHNGSPYLRAYTHCSRNKPGVSMILINMSNSTTFNVTLHNDFSIHPEINMSQDLKSMQLQREEYHLTPHNGNIQSDVVLLNGKPLKLNSTTMEIPDMKPVFVNSSSPISVLPDSFVFVTIRNFKAPACA